MAIRKLGASYDAIPQKSKQNHGMIAAYYSVKIRFFTIRL